MEHVECCLGQSIFFSNHDPITLQYWRQELCLLKKYYPLFIA
jgi:hypothetical protein